MKTISFIISFLFGISSAAGQYAYLYIQHPQQTWLGGQGTIEDATLYAYEKGIYTQNDLYLSFSARDLGFQLTDSLEIQLTFTLPDNAVVIDSWLLIDSTMVQSKIMDRWTASTIYESIVKRRRDPSVLYKDYSNYYQLRVYPLPGTKRRTVKISYLTKNHWTGKSAISPLPVHILRASKYLPTAFAIRSYPANTSVEPYIPESPGLTGTLQTDTSGHGYYGFSVPASGILSTMNLAVASSMQNGIYVSRFRDGNDGIYQIAFKPSIALNINSGRKVALLFDYDPSKSPLTATDVISTVRSFLIDNFSATDSINLIFSGVTTRRVSQTWIAGDSASIVHAFALAGSAPFSGYSNLPSLLADGIDFIQSRGNKGVTWLIANTDQIGTVDAANSLINDLMNLMPNKIPFHACDFNVYSSQGVYLNSQYYPGNQYFYDNLARLTNGSNKRMTYDGSLAGTLTLSAAQLRGTVEVSDVYTTLAGGFCYGRIPIGTNGLQTIGLDETIFQTGKFNGTFPLIIDVAGIVGDSVFSMRISVPEDSTVSVDSVAGQVWAGNYVASLESGSLTNDVIRQIIAASLTDRVLTRYTAFLCLDPKDTVVVCASCTTQTPITNDVQKQPPRTQQNDSLLQAYPNPFNSQTVLNVRLPAGVKGNDVTLRIYNVLGQLVYSFPTTSLSDRATTKIVWNGTTDHNTSASSGVYFVMLSTPKGRVTTKLLLLK